MPKSVLQSAPHLSIQTGFWYFWIKNQRLKKIKESETGVWPPIQIPDSNRCLSVYCIFMGLNKGSLLLIPIFISSLGVWSSWSAYSKKFFQGSLTNSPLLLLKFLLVIFHPPNHSTHSICILCGYFTLKLS